MGNSKDVDSSIASPAVDGGNDAERSQDRLLFDHHRAANQHLHFKYARQSFTTGNLLWSDPTLSKLHIIDDRGDYTNTGLLLSDENPFAVKCALFQGDTKTTMLDHVSLHGSVLSLINEGMIFLNRHNPESAWPEVGLRETLVNAILHRDYRYSGPTLITVFDQRIEIVSLGGLVEGLEVNDLLNGICQPCNAWLADITNALGLSENYGTGISRIMDSYANSAASPQLRVGPSSVVMVLPRPVLADSPWPVSHSPAESRTRSSGTGDEDGSNEGTTATRYAFPVVHPPTTDSIAHALTGSRVIAVAPLRTVTLSPDAIQAPELRTPPASPVQSLEAVTLHLFAQTGVELSRGQIERSLGISKNQAAYVLRNLVSSGKISRHGRSRATQYSLN